MKETQTNNGVESDTTVAHYKLQTHGPQQYQGFYSYIKRTQ